MVLMENVMYLMEHRLHRELAMGEAEYVSCPHCKASFQRDLKVNTETDVQCPRCEHEFVVILEDRKAA